MKIIAAAVSILLAGFSPPSPDQTRDLEHRSPTIPGQRIELRGLSGSEIEFKSWEKNEVALMIHVRIEASDEEYEQAYVKALEIRETRSDASLILEFVELRRGPKGSGFWGIFTGGNYVRKEIRGEVYVPRSNPLTTDFRYGSIALEDMKGELNILGKNNTLSLKNCSNVQTVENDYGESTLEQCGGALDLRGTSSKVNVRAFTGTVKIDAPYSTIRLGNISQSAIVTSQSGRVTAEAVGGDLTVRADYSTIVLSATKGFVTVGTKSGSLKVKTAQGLSVDAPYTTIDATDVSSTGGRPVSLSGQSGSITLENIKGDIQLEAPYGNISLRNIQGAVDLQSRSSTVSADDVTGNWNSRTEYCTLRLRGLRSRSVVAINKSNRIALTLATVPDRIEIRNEYGGIDVALPKGFSGEIALDAEYGNVETDFPIRVKKTGSSAYAVGTVGSGTGKITLETKSANIELIQR